MKKKILLYGVGTYKNRGVEAIVNSTINQIDTNKYDLTVATVDMPYNANRYTDKVKYINHNKKDSLNDYEKELELKYKNMPFDYRNFELLYQGDVAKEMEQADICISAGGDNYCYNPCTWLYALDELSMKLGKKTVLWGSSLFEHIDDLELINNLNNFDVLVIRESLTLDAIKDYVDKEKIIFVRDPAFSLATKKVNLNKWYKNRKYVVLNVSPLTIKNDLGYQAVVDLMKYILKETTYSICLLPHVTTDDCNDLDILSRLADEFRDDNKVYLEEDSYDCTELKYIISKSKLTVAARTHASIAAYSSCIPTLVIGYSVKAKGIAKDLFGDFNDYVINSKELTSELLIEKFKFIDKNKDSISKVLAKQMPAIKEETAHIFDKVMEKLDLLDKKTICLKSKCLGCGLCASMCPVGAITMEENEEGYKYPHINLDKCIHCNKCRNICPILKDEESNFEREYYALKNKNYDERMKSTSGGAFSILARYVLSKGGVVYGCEMVDNKTSHIRVTNEEELFRIRGSKYIQSDLSNIFKSLREDVENKKLVLFSGTPCQMGVVKSLVGKNYDNLLLVSVVCHGIMNKKLLDKHIEGLENENNKKLTEWNFREKDNNSWTRSSVSYKLDGTKKTVDFINDKLMYLYLKNVILRESCYRCKYKDKGNIADIVIADYWGIEVTNPEFFDDKGVSTLIVNSEKGKKFLDKINLKKEADIAQGSYEDILTYNPCFVRSVERPLLRNTALLKLDKLPFNILSDVVRGQIVQKEYDKAQQELNNLRLENSELNSKLDSIYNSTRWRVIDKPMNAINKLIGRNKQ